MALGEHFLLDRSLGTDDNPNPSDAQNDFADDDFVDDEVGEEEEDSGNEDDISGEFFASHGILFFGRGVCFSNPMSAL